MFNEQLEDLYSMCEQYCDGSNVIETDTNEMYYRPLCRTKLKLLYLHAPIIKIGIKT